MTVEQLIEQFKIIFDNLTLEDKRKLLKELLAVGSPPIVPTDKINLSTD